MKHAQIVMGLKGHGKSTYCKLIAKYAETKGRKIRIVNLDPSVDKLEFEEPIADIRDHITAEDYKQIDEKPEIGSGLEHVLNHILQNSEWLIGAISGIKDNDYVIFDCPGESDNFPQLNVLKLFTSMLAVQNFRTCAIFVRDANRATDGFSFIASCLTPVASYINLQIPHVCVFMKIDTLSEEDKSRIHLFINSDIKDVLRYENNKRNAVPPQERDTSYAHLAAVGAQVVDGHNIVRKKYFPLDIREEAPLGSLLVIIDEVMGITVESE